MPMVGYVLRSAFVGACAVLAAIAIPATSAHAQPLPDGWTAEAGFAGYVVITDGTEKFDVLRVPTAVKCAAGFEFDHRGLGPQTESTPLWLPQATADFAGWAGASDGKPYVRWELCRDLPDGVLLTSLKLPGTSGVTPSPATIAALQSVMQDPAALPFVVPTSVRIAFGEQSKPIPLSLQTGLLYTPAPDEPATTVFAYWPGFILESSAFSRPCSEAPEVDTLVAPRWQLRDAADGVKACTNLGSGSIEVHLQWIGKLADSPRIKLQMEATLAAIAEVYAVSRPASNATASAPSVRDNVTSADFGIAATYGNTGSAGANGAAGFLLKLQSKSRNRHGAFTVSIDMALGFSAAKQLSFDLSLSTGATLLRGTATELAVFALAGVDRFGLGDAADRSAVIATTAPYVGARFTLGHALFASGAYLKRFWADAHPREFRVGLGYRWEKQPTKTRVVELGLQASDVGAMYLAMFGFAI